jgi:hypothetical protein
LNDRKFQKKKLKKLNASAEKACDGLAPGRPELYSNVEATQLGDGSNSNRILHFLLFSTRALDERHHLDMSSFSDFADFAGNESVILVSL